MLTYGDLKEKLDKYENEKNFLSHFFSSDNAIIQLNAISRANKNKDAELTAEHVMRVNIIIASIKNINDIKVQNSNKILNRTLREIAEANSSILEIEACAVLIDADIYNEVNLNKILSHAKPNEIINVLVETERYGLLDNNRFDQIISHPDIDMLLQGFNELVSQRNKSPKFNNFSTFMAVFIGAMCAGPGITFLILIPPLFPFAIGALVFGVTLSAIPFARRALAKLYRYSIYPIKSQLDRMLKHEKPSELINGISILKFSEQSEYYRNILGNSNYPYGYAKIFNILHDNHIFIKKNLDIISTNKNVNLDKISSILHTFLCRNFKNNLTDKLFAQTFEYADILTDARIWQAICRLPQHLLKPKLFGNIISICGETHRDKEAKIVALEEHLTRLLNANDANQVQNIFTQRQNTHTASVHQSVSKSARRLIETYKLKPNDVDNNITAIKEWSKKLDKTIFTQKAAFNAIKRLTRSKNSYEDIGSKVSTRQLLALAWCAINDDTNRKCAKPDALDFFIEGLSESQREYNKTEKGQDKPACAGGTFNKIMEKLAVISPLVEIVFITTETAQLKLRLTTKEQAFKYLEEQYHKLNSENFNALLSSLREGDDISSIWESIKSTIASDMQDYQQLYSAEKAYETFIGGGKYLELDIKDIDAWYEKISHQEQIKPIIGSPSNAGLFAAKHLIEGPDNDYALLHDETSQKRNRSLPSS